MADGDYINLNTCRSFNVTATVTLAKLADQTCSEVLILNKSGENLKIYDNNFTASNQFLLIGDGESITLRGLTNTDQVSAQTAANSGLVYYRTQFYSNNPSR